MKRIVVVLLMLATPALADEPKFAPFMIDQATYHGLINYLGEVPAKYANPVISALAQKEKEAINAAAAGTEKTKQGVPEAISPDR